MKHKNIAKLIENLQSIVTMSFNKIFCFTFYEKRANTSTILFVFFYKHNFAGSFVVCIQYCGCVRLIS